MIRVLIVDDQNIIREGIKVLLKDAVEIEIVGYAEDGERALQEVETIRPDVVLLDINLPGIDGLTVANQISHKFPLIKVIVLSSYEDNSYVIKAMKSSAKGYLLKSVSSKELEWSIKLVHQGYSAFKSELLTTITSKPNSASSELATAEETPKTSIKKGNNIPAKSISVTSAPYSPQKQRERSDEELALMLAKNQFREKYSSYRQQRKGQAFHSVRVNKAKKTMMSFEFRLLVLIVLFSLGFLVFVALS